MPERKIYDGEGHAHFVTFSCDRNRRILERDKAKAIVLDVLGSELDRQNGRCLGFVVMPDHVHAVLWFPESNRLSRFMHGWKRKSSHALKNFLRQEAPEYAGQMDMSGPLWRRRFYDFNIFSDTKLREKLDYMHGNPVRAGLAGAPTDWPFSSARWYARGEPVGVPICFP